MPDQLMKDEQGRWDTGRIALIVTILVQLIATIWWTSKLDSRVSVLELQIVANTKDIIRLDTAREASNLQSQHLIDQNTGIFNILQELKGRSDTLHPELNDKPGRR